MIKPVGDMVRKVLLQHKTPLFDSVQKTVLKEGRVDLEPEVNYTVVLDLFRRHVQLLVTVNLKVNKYLSQLSSYRQNHHD